MKLLAKKILAKGILLWLLLAAVLDPLQAESTSSEDQPTEVRYSVLMGSNNAGFQVTSRGAKGEWRYQFQFNDRGRGPKLSTRIVLDEHGIPTRLETSGHDYRRNVVDESFVSDGQKATWKNSAEAGEKKLPGRAFYVSTSQVPEELAVLARALLAAPEGKLPLLPEGEASIERVGEIEVEANGHSRKVIQYAISGLGLSPQRLWLDPDQTFFALGDAYFAVIREGWKPALDSLVQAQNEAKALRMAALVKALTRRPTTPVAFTGATVFDSEAAVARRGFTVVVRGNRILAVGRDGRVEIPSDAETIDATKKTLLPGLWDMHVHLGLESSGLMHLAAGVTTVRDLANDIDLVLGLRQEFDEGTAIGPRVLLAGVIDGRGPYQSPSKVLADTEEEARAAVDRYAELGYEQIKIYSSIKPELVPPIIQRARKHGLRVSGHVPISMTAEKAVKAGFDEIQHINMLFLNFWAQEVPDTRTLARFTAVAERAAELDLSSEQVQSLIRLLKERQIVVDPTVNLYESQFTDRPGSVGAGFASIAHRLPPQSRRKLLGGGLPVPEGKDQRYRDSFRALLKMIGALHRAGIQLVAGTDATAGFSLHRELEIYVEAGIPANEVLQLATLGAASVMKRDSELGSVAPGRLADLVLVDGDPTENISDIRKVRMVMKDGNLYQSSEIYSSLGILP